MDITTNQKTRVEYVADVEQLGVEGVALSAVVEGTSLEDGRVTFTYSDIEGRGQITFSQKHMALVLDFGAKLSHVEAVRLGLIPAPTVPVVEEPSP